MGSPSRVANYVNIAKQLLAIMAHDKDGSGNVCWCGLEGGGQKKEGRKVNGDGGEGDEVRVRTRRKEELFIVIS